MADLENMVTVIFNYTGDLQSFTVPSGVSSVTIQAVGASGGNSENNPSDYNPGGLGASLQGVFDVSPGEMLTLLVGGVGGASFGCAGQWWFSSARGGGGGGGSFVWRGQSPSELNADTLLVAAGGGGGASPICCDSGPTAAGVSAVVTPEGTPSRAGIPGGSNGNGGNGAGGTGGGGGGGVFTSGGNAEDNRGGSGGGAIVEGGYGGASSAGYDEQGGFGGFGGGGGGGGSIFDDCSSYLFGGAGGGGGYSGGGGGSSDFYGAGGGGGSLNNGTNQVNTEGVSTVDGNGIVVISYLCIPEMTLEITAMDACTYDICGTVTCFGTPVSGVDVSFTTSIAGAGSVVIDPTTTDVEGNYESTMTMAPGTIGTVTVTSFTTVHSSPVSITKSITVNCPAPIAVVSPNFIDFGNQLVSTASSPQTVTLMNTGTTDLIISDFEITGANPNDFVMLLFSCNNPITPGASCTFDVLFIPTTVGSRNAILSFFDNATDSPQQVHLTGNGTAPTAEVSPDSIDFGNQLLDTSSFPKTITVSNTGTADLIIDSITITGPNMADFNVYFNTCTTVYPGSSCTIDVIFTPTAVGSRNATFGIFSNASDSPKQVILSGNGTIPTAVVSPDFIDFGNQLVNTSSSPQTITVTNTGSGDLLFDSITITGSNMTDFHINSNTCTTVQPGESCMIEVTFEPTTTGLRSATLSIFDNAPEHLQQVLLTGNGIGTPIANVLPANIDFGNQPVSTSSTPQTITVVNTGTAELVIDSITITGPNMADFHIDSNTCPSVLPGNSCSIPVIFGPTDTGLRNATLSIFDNASDSPQQVSLIGNGVGTPIANVIPTIINFGSQPVSTSSSPQMITVINSGTEDLLINNIAISGENSTNFQIVSNKCTTVAPGASCTIEVRFSPTTIGEKSATLNIYTNASDSPHYVLLNGNGLPSANLLITKNASVVHLGSNKLIIFTIKVTNSGPNAASNVVVTDPLPSNTNFVLAVATKGKITSPPFGGTGTVFFSLGYISAGTSATMTIMVMARNKEKNIINTATVTTKTFNLNPNHSASTHVDK